MRRIIVCLSLAFILFISCSEKKEINWLEKEYNEIERSARGSTVTFYMWGGSTIINTWIDSYVATLVKERFDVTLNRVPMDASVFISKLMDQKSAHKTNGSMDLLWINGENFKNAYGMGLLYGPFTHKLPNFNKYIDPATVEYDFGFPVMGYEAPYGKAQFVFEYDSAKISEFPDTFESLLSWVKEHPGRFTYPQPPDFTGSAFVRQVYYAVTGGYEQYMNGFDAKLFLETELLLWTYLNQLKPYLWQKGKTYPKDIAALDTLFERGEVDLNMSYHQSHAQNKITHGQYPDTVRSFVMKDASISNTHFIAIPYNSPNKAGALVVINQILSVEVQYNKNTPEAWGDFTILDMNRLDPKDRSLFKNLDLGAATLSIEELALYAVPEIPSSYLEKLEQGWEDNILKK
ncbi:MAG: ABC transporter substrate-binding protein [Candidatus Pacearchaeota archaeon]|nr:ABC transporter substrate-binding protein [Candidatus Pacearchaeota archaeon]